MLDSRLRRRLLQHLLLGFGSVALTVIFMHLFPKRDLISRLSIGTAYPALFLTAITLLLGPFNVLLRKLNPVSFDLRRDFGIWAGICALVHTAVGLNVHLRGKMWLYFVDAQHHFSARGAGRQRLDHSADQFKIVADPGWGPRGKRPQRNRLRR